MKEVPLEWIFEHYLKLNEKLTGQNLMILSPFNSKDKRPSFGIYVKPDGKTYNFRDFSTGISGDSIALVEKLNNLSTRGETAHKIISDYNAWLLKNESDYSLREFKVRQKYKVNSFVKRSWTNIDKKYWTKFHIGSKILEKFNVFPLESYTLIKEENGETKELTISGRDCIYGFFRNDGTLYKIYQPLVQDGKFIKVKDYIQGMDQLTYKTKYLIICSSLKDMMAFTKMKIANAEVIAPDSENILIPTQVMSSLKLKYQNICTLLDNDDAGIIAMKNYKEKYDISPVHLKLSKDLSDSVKDHGLIKTQEVLIPLLREALCIKSVETC